MKYYVIISVLLINACTVLKKDGATTSKKSNRENAFKIPSYNLIVELEDVIWEDSSVVTFVSIHPDYRTAPMILTASPCGEQINFSGPLTLGTSFDTCSFHPIRYDWKSQNSYFLIDDFNGLEDSLLYFSYQVTINMNCQNFDQIYQSNSPLLRTELVKYSDSLVSKSEKIYATKEWFSIWCEKNPAYQRLRIKAKNRITPY